MESTAFGGVFLTNVAAFVLALIGSAAALKWYRVSVGRLMSPHAGHDGRPQDARTPDLARCLHARPSRSYRVPIGRLRKNTLSTCAIYLVSGLIAALATTLLVAPLAFGAGLLPWRAICLFTVVYAWPIVVILTQVAHMRLRMVLAATCVQVGLFLAIATWISLAPSQSGPSTPANEWQSVPAPVQVLVFWLASQSMPTVATLLVLNRRIRAVGPLMLVFCLFALNVAHGALIATLDKNGLVSAATLLFGAIEMGGWPYPPDVAPRIAGGFAIAAVVGLSLAWQANKRVSSRYTRKRESEQTIFADVVWAVFSLSAAQSLVLGGGWWGLTGLGIFAVHKAATVVGFRAIRRFRPDRGPELLWLRRFKGGVRTRMLYSALQARWRWVGPMHLIGAPDLATQTIEPYRFLDFLAGRMRRHFIWSDGDLAERLDALDIAPDRDARFRVNEFFCSHVTWRTAVRALMQRTHLIVMDLRGFERDEGVREELAILASARGFSRLVLFCREHDRAVVTEALSEALKSVEAPHSEPLMIDPTGRERSVLNILLNRLNDVENAVGVQPA
jgi:hypothetical protein